MTRFILGCSDNQAGSRLPRLHCVLAWQQDVTDTNYNGNGIYWGSILESDIQYTKKTFNLGQNFHRLRKTTEPQSFPVHAVLLKNGKVLMAGGSSNINYNKNLPDDVTKSKVVIEHSVAIYDPIADTVTEVPPPPQNQYQGYGLIHFPNLLYHDLFCSGHSVLPNGKVLFVGGTEFYSGTPGPGPHNAHFPGFRNTSIYDTDTNSWSAGSQLVHGRWYPTTLVLGDGRIVAIAGHTDYLDESKIIVNNTSVTRHENTDLDFYNPVNNVWENTFNAMMSVSGNPQGEPNYYPRTFLLPNGKVFFATKIGTLPAHDRIANNYKNYLWNPADNTWVETNNAANAKGVYQEQTAVMLPIMPPYNEADVTVIIIDGGDSFQCKPLSADKSWVNSGRGINKRRWNGNSVILPDGDIMLVGGVEGTGGQPLDSTAVNQVEFYDLRSGNWELGKEIYIARNYHSTAILLPDARVLISGSNYNMQQGDFNSPPQSYHQDLSFEIYSPDYLYRGPRPVFSINKEFFNYGDNIQITLQEGWKIKNLRRDRVGLIRLGSVTHAFNFDQRYVGLKIDGDVDIPYVQPSTLDLNMSEFDAIIPNNPNLLPPGYYMLFLLSGLVDIQGLPGFPRLGAPSIAKIIKVERSVL